MNLNLIVVQLCAVRKVSVCKLTCVHAEFQPEQVASLTPRTSHIVKDTVQVKKPMQDTASSENKPSSCRRANCRVACGSCSDEPRQRINLEVGPSLETGFDVVGSCNAAFGQPKATHIITAYVNVLLTLLGQEQVKGLSKLQGQEARGSTADFN